MEPVLLLSLVLMKEGAVKSLQYKSRNAKRNLSKTCGCLALNCLQNPNQPAPEINTSETNKGTMGGHRHIDSYVLSFSLSATVCQTSASSSLLQSSQSNRQRKNTRLISSAMRIVCVSRFSRKMPSPSLILLLVPVVALGQQLVRIPVYCNSYVLYRWREVVLCELRELVKKNPVVNHLK